jgi:hypothetical protein
VVKWEHAASDLEDLHIAPWHGGRTSLRRQHSEQGGSGFPTAFEFNNKMEILVVDGLSKKSSPSIGADAYSLVCRRQGVAPGRCNINISTPPTSRFTKTKAIFVPTLAIMADQRKISNFYLNKTEVTTPRA